MNIIAHIFWDVVRTNRILDRLWMWSKRNTPLPLIINRMHPYPTGIEVEVTTKCGLKCVMCEHTYWDEPARDMTLEQFHYIINQFPNLRWVGLTGIGEGSLHRDWNKMLKYLRYRGIKVEFFDTLNFIGSGDIKLWMRLGVDMWISLDAATRETYEKVMVKGDYDKVIRNARTAFKAKGDVSNIWFHYIINRLNIGEVLQFIDMVDDIRRGEKTLIQFTRVLHNFDEIHSLYTEIPDELRGQVEAKGKERGIEIVWNADVPQKKPHISKCLEFFEPFIFVTGHVIPCCAGNEANGREYQKDTALGNIFEEPFGEIWEGKRYRELRAMIRQGQVPPPCVTCPLYMH